MVLMASSGYIYTQVMDDSSSAKNGPFYITNVLEVEHSDLKVQQPFRSYDRNSITQNGSTCIWKYIPIVQSNSSLNTLTVVLLYDCLIWTSILCI